MSDFKLAKWGNSYAIRLPAAMVKKNGWKEGQVISADVLTFNDRTASMTREEALEIIRDTNWKLPKGFKFDREEANAR